MKVSIGKWKYPGGQTDVFFYEYPSFHFEITYQVSGTAKKTPLNFPYPKIKVANVRRKNYLHLISYLRSIN